MPTKDRDYWLAKEDKVPENYFAMSELFKLPSLAVNEKQAREIRFGTYDEVRRFCKKNKICDMIGFFNANADLMLADMNQFAKNRKIAPVAHLIEMFGEKKETERKDGTLLHISFGIRKDYLMEYLNSKGETIPKKKKVGHPKSNDAIRYKMAKIVIEEEGEEPKYLRMRKNPIYECFRAWCTINKVKIGDACLMAMKLLVEQYPCEGLPSIKEFEKPDVYRKLNVEQEEELRRVNLTVKNGVYEMSKLIIDNYNKNPENMAKPKLSFSIYATTALDKLNGAMPLKYSNPELNKELEKQAEQERIKQKLYGEKKK